MSCLTVEVERPLTIKSLSVGRENETATSVSAAFGRQQEEVCTIPGPRCAGVLLRTTLEGTVAAHVSAFDELLGHRRRW